MEWWEDLSTAWKTPGYQLNTILGPCMTAYLAYKHHMAPPKSEPLPSTSPPSVSGQSPSAFTVDAIDMQSGELWVTFPHLCISLIYTHSSKYPLAILHYLLELFSDDQAVVYDIGCAFSKEKPHPSATSQYEKDALLCPSMAWMVPLSQMPASTSPPSCWGTWFGRLQDM